MSNNDGYTGKVHDFHDSLNQGEKGEIKVMTVLNNLLGSSLKEVQDVREVREYQEKDIDFILSFKTGNVETLEIKTDFTTYPNFFYEELSSVETGSIGCFEKTQADIMIYYYDKLGFFYILEVEKLKKFFKENKALFIQKGYQKKVRNTRYDGSYYHSLGYAIPRTMLNSIFPRYFLK